APVGDNWSGDLLLATGTYTGNIGFAETDALTLANVFVEVGSTDTMAASLQFAIGPLGGGGGVGPDLGTGGALDFGYNGQSQIITLTNTGDEAANFLNGENSGSITGANA